MTAINEDRLPHVRAALYGQPWMIQDQWLEAICEIFERTCAKDKIVWQGEPGESKVAYQVSNGVGIVKLMGPIFPRANLMTRMSGATSTEEFKNNFSRAMDDDDVKNILMLIDSPGGAVAGIFEAASLVYSSRNQGKSIVSLCEGTCASAAYLIGSQADEIYATEASVVGSIGVVMAIADDTRKQENEGVKMHVLKTGPLKAVGVGPVTDAQLDHFRSLMDDFFGRFKGSVKRARPQMDVDKVSTGAVWIGKAAQYAGLIDGIGDLDELMNALAA